MVAHDVRSRLKNITHLDVILAIVLGLEVNCKDEESQGFIGHYFFLGPEK